jgi:hypothetical protein
MELPARGGRSRTLAAIAVLATIALVAAGASPANAVPIKRGQSTLILDQRIFSGLDPLGVGILPIAPAEASLGGESFPITGGEASRNGQRARINHAGGIVFAGDNAAVRVVRPRLRLSDRTFALSALVGGQRMSFLSLANGTITTRGRRLTIRGINAFLTLEAAGALNQAFATDFFQEGTRLGRLRISMTLVL